MKNLFTLKRTTLFACLFTILTSLSSVNLGAQEHTIAREWNDVLLEAIRDDFARPTVHARNLFHVSTVMYDAWAVYDETSRPFFLDNAHWGYEVPFDGVIMPENIQEAQETAISYAAYRLLSHRFENSPGHAASQWRFDNLFDDLELDPAYTSTDYVNEGAAALGNYLAEQMIAFGLQDGANEQNDYANLYYEPVNEELDMDEPGNSTMTDPNRWQPLRVTQFIDQGGNEFDDQPEFLSPEWGDVIPFSMTEDDVEINERDGNEYRTWMNPGNPPYIDPEVPSDIEDLYKWTFCVTAIWSGHLDPSDGVMLDISPASLGNISTDEFPMDFADYDQFYDLFDGGDIGQGYDMNPKTGMPYEEQIVPRGDYGRILAEFWADGPDSETPPGHWFTLYNDVVDHDDFTGMWNGQGDPLPQLEYDVKAYLTLGGGMHDVAIAAWSIKGWHDYLRPVSAIRWLAENGQSTDPEADNYHMAGIPLLPGHIESVEAGDPLEGIDGENIGKIKIWAWKGPDFIINPNTDEAGVDWILVDNWWPYQRPTFVTPPFAGFVSGHSTYSRCAADLMTFITGDNYFPGGMAEYHCPQNQFLVFEEGPSQDVTLQWATYQDASDQCSLSRIWGGIHPPADDILGRQIGAELAPKIWDFASLCFDADVPRIESFMTNVDVVSDSEVGAGTFTITATFDKMMDQGVMPSISFLMEDPTMNTLTLTSTTWTSDMSVEFAFDVADANETLTNIWMQIDDAVDTEGVGMEVYLTEDMLDVDTENPMALSLAATDMMITDADAGGTFSVTIGFNEEMDQNMAPTISWPMEDASNTLADAGTSMWLDGMTYQADYTVADADEEVDNIDIESVVATDLAGNEQVMYNVMDQFSIDTKNPDLFLLSANTYNITDDFIAENEYFTLIAIFDEDMDQAGVADFSFPVEDPLANTLTFAQGEWINTTTYRAEYTMEDNEETLEDIDVSIADLADWVGNGQVDVEVADHFDINTFTVGIAENAEAGMSVYPNPVIAGGIVTVQLAEMAGVVTMQVYDVNGKIAVAEQEVTPEGDRIELSTDNFAAGLYFVHVWDADQQIVMQLEVQ